MDLLCYEEIKYNFIEQTNECNICYDFFFENFKCKRCSFICCPRCFNNFIFQTIQTVPYVVFSALVF